MEEPLVSILIPFKNTSEYIAECLESIIKQTYINWEVLAINDHSTDNSSQIVNSFEKKDKRVMCFDNKGNGIIKALRTAYAESKGSFITRMDADDIMTSDKLRLMVAALLHKGEGHVAIGLVKYFSHRGISSGYERYEKWLNELTKTGTNYNEIYKECVIPSPCWMTYKEDLEASGAFESDRYPEDYDLAFRFYKNELKCIPCNKLLHHWRDYDTRTSRTSEQYAQNYFLDIKLHYFLMLEHNLERPLILWGAGNKGKKIAKGLLARHIDFQWLCDNPKKIGKIIYGKLMHPYTILQHLKNPHSIITVANEEAQTTIRDYLATLDQQQATDYFFFC